MPHWRCRFWVAKAQTEDPDLAGKEDVQSQFARIDASMNGSLLGL